MAIDGSSLGRTLPSWHYIIRAGINIRERKPVKLSIAVDTRSKKILSARVRSKIAHDMKDVKCLMKHLAKKPSKVIADKGYDAEWFRAMLAEQGIGYCIPTKGKVVHGFYRKRNKVDKRVYRRRAMVESSFFRLKQLFGRSVNCIQYKMIRNELFLRMILYNLNLRLYLI